MAIPGIRSGHRKAPHRPYRRTSLLRPTTKTLSLRTLSGKLLLLLAVVLMAVAVTQKPSMLLLSVTPKGMAATALRLFTGLLAAVVIKACVPGMARRSHALLGSRWNTLVAFALMLILLALMCSVLGSRAFSTLRLGDLVMHRAYVTQVVAFSVLWLAMLR
jgi:hypothetical protein